MMSKLIDPIGYQERLIQQGIPDETSLRLELIHEGKSQHMIRLRYGHYQGEPIYALVDQQNTTNQLARTKVLALQLGYCYLEGVAAGAGLRHATIRIFTESPGKKEE